MHLATRQFIFFVCLVLFVIIGGYLLLAIQGYEFDFTELQFKKTGGVFLRFSPRDADLIVNGKVHDTSPGFFSDHGSALVKGLLPGTYSVALSYGDHVTWRKDVWVSPGFVTSFRHIKLWSSVFESKKLLNDVEAFWITKEGLLSYGTDRALHFGTSTLKGDSVADHHESSPYVLTRAGSSYFFYDLALPRKQPVLIHELFLRLKTQQLKLPGAVPILKAFSLPSLPTSLYLLTLHGFYLLEVADQTIRYLGSISRPELAVFHDDELFIFNDREVFTVFQLSKTSSSSLPFSLPLRTFSVSSAGRHLSLITPEHQLYLYDREDEMLRKISSSTRISFFDPHENELVFLLRDGALYSFALRAHGDDVKYLPFTRTRIPLASLFPLSPNSGSPTSLGAFDWVDDTSFLALAEDKLILGELDFRAPLNSRVLASGVTSYVYYGGEVYFLTMDGVLNTIRLTEE